MIFVFFFKEKKLDILSIQISPPHKNPMAPPFFLPTFLGFQNNPYQQNPTKSDESLQYKDASP